MNYHQKSKKDKCPTCRQLIEQYQVCNTAAHSESGPFDFKDLLTQEETTVDEGGTLFECLDHNYFRDEVGKLIALRNEIELDRFHRRISNKDPTRQGNLDLQWNAIKQIELRLLDLQD